MNLMGLSYHLQAYQDQACDTRRNEWNGPATIHFLVIKMLTRTTYFYATSEILFC